MLTLRSRAIAIVAAAAIALTSFSASANAGSRHGDAVALAAIAVATGMTRITDRATRPVTVRISIAARFTVVRSGAAGTDATGIANKKVPSCSASLAPPSGGAFFIAHRSEPVNRPRTYLPTGDVFQCMHVA